MKQRPYRFNPAPGWPSPPSGWVPPAGWRPDPAWPPAPAGWQFWVAVEPVAAPKVIAATDTKQAGSGRTIVRRAAVESPEQALVPKRREPHETREPRVGWKQRRLEKKARKEYEKALADWTTKGDLFTTQAAYLQTIRDGGVAAPGVALKSGERVVCTTSDGNLVEPVRQPGHYIGASSGVSIPTGGRTRVRVGATRGTFIPGDVVQSKTDEGTVVVTDRRVLFVGNVSSREWAYSKLLDYELRDAGHTVMIAVSNRQKVSGVFSGGHAIGLATQVGYGVFTSGEEEFAGALAQALSEHNSKRPVPPEVAD